MGSGALIVTALDFAAVFNLTCSYGPLSRCRTSIYNVQYFVRDDCFLYVLDGGERSDISCLGVSIFTSSPGIPEICDSTTKRKIISGGYIPAPVLT